MYLKKIVDENKELFIKTRRELHKIPEVAFEEKKTSAYIAEYLKQENLEVITNIATTGVVGLLRTNRPGPTLMVRADMDALPVTEQTGLEFTSTHAGRMHACGHDSHMAMALGAVTVLNKIKDQLNGTIKFVFQPAEEGFSGAKAMIGEGVLENPTVDFAVGCHVWPLIPQGAIGVKPGPLMAASDRFDLEIRGISSHGAMPHLAIDALEVSTQVVSALQRIVSRNINPLIPAVITIGSLQAGTTFNVIPEVAHLRGTVRTFDKGVRKELPKRIEQVIKGVCDSMNATYKLNYLPIYPPVINDDDAVETIRKSAWEVVGKENTLVPEMSMCAEDMSFYLEKVKGCFYFLGSGQENGLPLHNSRFDFDEDILATGVEMFGRTALSILGK